MLKLRCWPIGVIADPMVCQAGGMARRERPPSFMLTVRKSALQAKQASGCVPEKEYEWRAPAAAAGARLTKQLIDECGYERLLPALQHPILGTVSHFDSAGSSE